MSRRFRKSNQIGHRNLESQQNDNIPRSVGETSLKQEKLQKRSKSTKCYIHFHNFPESSAKNFNVASHLKVSQIPKIKSNWALKLWIPAEWQHSKSVCETFVNNKKIQKRWKSTKCCIYFMTFRNNWPTILMLLHI